MFHFINIYHFTSNKVTALANNYVATQHLHQACETEGCDANVAILLQMYPNDTYFARYYQLTHF